MNNVVKGVVPNVTTMIRMDHTHVMALFHRFRADTSARRKRALVRNACLALEVHAQLEEEIFYPALQSVIPDDDVLQKSEPEHDEMKQLIAALRETLEEGSRAPSKQLYERFLELMRVVIHHVADEETRLLPAAELLLTDQLADLGLQMTKRRMQLLRPHTGELVASTVRSFPIGAAAAAVLATGAVVAAATMLSRRNRHGRPHWSSPFR